MCGFIGFISDINDKQISYKEEKFKYYLNELNNRGPDYTEHKKITINDKVINVGFSRLAIQDLSSKSNKIFHSKNSLLLFNGEIYNQKSLKEKYLNNISFETTSDTEVLFSLLNRYGSKIIKEIRGIYSIVYLDFKNNLIECIRDLTGTKPLYYLFKQDSFFFSSEAWFLYSLSQKKINKESLNFFLNYGFTPEENTLIENVKKVKPRSILEVNINNLNYKKNKYFDLNNQKDAPLISKENLNQTIEESVKMNLLTDTKIATFLSGGVDSSLITSIAKKYNNKIEGFTTVYLPEKKFGKFNQDFFYSKKLSKDLGFKLNVTYIDNLSSTLDDFYKVTDYLDEPVSNLNFMNTYWQSKEAKIQGFKVILTGDGSDELFCGYDRYQKLFLSNYLKFLSPFNNKIKKYNSLNKANLPMFFYSIFNNNNLSEILNKEQFEQNQTQFNLFKNINFDSKVDYINYFDFRFWLTNESNYKLDKCTMINSVEARIPFQDKDLIEKLFFTKNSEKFSFFNRKFLLKKNNFLPNYIKNRKKIGWFSPDKLFLDVNLKNIRDKVFPKNELKNQEIFNEKNLNLLLDSYYEKNYLIKREITTIILFQSWYNKVLSLK